MVHKPLSEYLKSDHKTDEEAGNPQYSRFLEMIEKICSFRREDLIVYVSEIKKRTDLDDETRKSLFRIAIGYLEEKQPEAALFVFSNNPELCDESTIQWVSKILGTYAKDQPYKAIEWLQKNEARFPDQTSRNHAKDSIITGVAKKDFEMAFQIGKEWNLSPGDVSSEVTQNIEPERFQECISAMRKQIPEIKDPEEVDRVLMYGFESIFMRVAEDGFDHSMEWLSSANLTEQEMDQFKKRLYYGWLKGENSEKWLTWLAETPLGSKASAEEGVQKFMGYWTKEDYKAAEKWLNNASPGSMKEVATMAYLKTIAPYDSENAEKWAETLPAEKQKDAFQEIFKALKEKNPEAADAFAKSRGINPKLK